MKLNFNHKKPAERGINSYKIKIAYLNLFADLRLLCEQISAIYVKLYKQIGT